jgi:hypothetical protein
MQSDVCEAEHVDCGERLRYAVDERLASDEADIRIFRCCTDQMLAAAEADLEPDIGDRLPKQSRDVAFGGGQID